MSAPMMNISLIITPGPGRRTVSVPVGTTISEFLRNRDRFELGVSIEGRQWNVNGLIVEESQYSAFVLTPGHSIHLVQGTKGNRE